mgnify:CR=1 FL=1
MNKTDLIIENIDKLVSSNEEVRINIGRIEQHLKDMNNRIYKHDSEIDSLKEVQTNTRIQMAKHFGVGGFGGILGAVIVKLVGG